jgi:hypothetical protein
VPGWEPSWAPSRRSGRTGGDLRLANLNDTVLNISEILGMNRLYRIFL